MALWVDASGNVYDDMGGKASSLHNWPSGLSPYTGQQQTGNKLVADAHTALNETDMVAVRCLKAGVAFPAGWQTYTIALRNIVNGTDTTSTSLPVKPAYPTGT